MEMLEALKWASDVSRELTRRARQGVEAEFTFGPDLIATRRFRLWLEGPRFFFSPQARSAPITDLPHQLARLAQILCHSSAPIALEPWYYQLPVGELRN